MIDPKVSSTDGSTAIGGDNTGPVVNVNTGEGSIVSVQVEHRVARELPSFLGDVIVLFSKQSLSEYGRGARRPLPGEVKEKVKYNNLPEDHYVLTDYYRHGLVLERAYRGVEQQNADARYLVRRKAGIVYEMQLAVACKQASVPTDQKIAFVTENAAMLVDAVVEQLLKDYVSSKAIKVEEEAAHLAVSLIVADAVIECEVLERLPNAPAA
jgi:hypothetical protein